MTAKLLYCSFCHSKADQKEKDGMALCPIHGWMSINFFHEIDNEIGLADNETEKAGNGKVSGSLNKRWKRL